jgi:D-alanine-D-alanine ligase
MSTNFLQKKIAVVCGGISTERNVSINSGLNVYNSLRDNGVETLLIEITNQGFWKLRNLNKANQDSFENNRDQDMILNILDNNDKKNTLKSLEIDLVFNSLHGKFGEDGQIQAILDILNIGYTGSGVMASSIAINKEFTYKLLDKFGIRVPKTFSISLSDNLQSIDYVIDQLSYPFIVKPNDGGSSIGVTLVNSKEELQNALDLAFDSSKTVLIQEFVNGVEVTCPVIGKEQSALIALPTGEIRTDNSFFDYQAKYDSNETLEIFPAQVPDSINDLIQAQAKKIHSLLNCKGLSRSDFIYVQKTNELVFLEINTSPGMTKSSLCPKSAQVINWSFFDLVREICESS